MSHIEALFVYFSACCCFGLIFWVLLTRGSR